MNDNLDDWLSQLGISENTQEETPTEESLPAVPEPEEEPIEQFLPPSNQPQNLSDEDFDDILENFGFDRPQEADAEEIEDDIEEADREAIELNEEEGESEGEVNTEEPIYVGEGIMAQIRDYENSPYTQEALNRLAETVWATAQTSESDFERGVIPNLNELADEVTDQSEEPLLPLNSPTLLLDESTQRFSGAEWYNEIQRKSIIVAGQGGIGSNLSFQLARMHPASLVLYDDDNVETVNMAGQLFARDDVGKSKVAAMSDMITAYTNMQNVYALKQRFESNTEAGDIMMCGFDNMEARKTFFLAWMGHVGNKPEEEKKNCLFLDGRLSIDTLQVFCITGDDLYHIEEYSDKYLFSDAEAEHTVCSMKQTTYLACMIGSIMTNLFTNWAANLLDPILPYDLPFFTEYDAQNMIFKTVK